MSKQQAFNADPKAKKQVNFRGNIESAGNTTNSSLSKKSKKLFRIFHKKLWKYRKCVLQTFLVLV